MNSVSRLEIASASPLTMRTKKVRIFSEKHLTNPKNDDIISESTKLFALHTNLQYKLNRQEHTLCVGSLT